jgi:hypothetical protein
MVSRPIGHGRGTAEARHEGPCGLVIYARLIGISYTISQYAAGTTMSAVSTGRPWSL